MDQQHKQTYFSLIIFTLGLLAAIIILQFPTTKQYILDLGQAGFVGALISGILYAFSFTSSLATAMFLNMSNQIHPVFIAILGGLGATIYDISVFIIIRQQTSGGFFHSLHEAMERRRRISNWLSLIIGITILGSPLPDELAAGFLGFIKMSTKKFVLISFMANTVGIYIITILH